MLCSGVCRSYLFLLGFIMSIGRTDYSERKERKINALNQRAIKSSVIANQEINSAHEMGSVIPLGQPILIGHHSEKEHRAHLKRIDAAYRRANEAKDKAAYYHNRADAAENNQSISGDDAEAVNRYKSKLEQLEAAQKQMKAVNKAWKQGKEALYSLGLTEMDIEKIKSKMQSYEKKPYPT